MLFNVDKKGNLISVISFKRKKVVEIPEKVSSINEGPFNQNKNLEELYLPKSLVTIGDRAFYHCVNLEKIHFNEGLKEIRENTVIGIGETLTNLNEIVNNFSYEFLSKYDPRNFVLGKYCSCCAHLEGAGSSIMKASILHPDCQNLVIKNEKGNIIAKSTLYINRNQGYGLFNNVEINTDIKDQKIKEQIYIKYKEAIKEFVRKYNECNKRKPITQINVGMGRNDLEIIIKSNDVEAKKITRWIRFFYLWRL